MTGFTETYQDKKNRTAALVITLFLHGAVVLILFFLMAWRAPDPPLPEYGIELNLGLDAAGSGNVQPQPEQTPAEPVTEENQPEEVAEKPEQQPDPEPVITKIESPVVVKPPVKEDKKPDPVKPPDPVKKPVEVKKEEPVKPKPTLDPKAAYTPGEAKDLNVKSPGQGDVKDAKGDQGVKEGKVDAGFLYDGIPGGGGGGKGSGLSMGGWKWDREPVVDLPANEQSGKIVFEIEVDANGDITRITTIERGISATAEKLCREEILKRTFTPLGDKVPEKSTGRVTMFVKLR